MITAEKMKKLADTSKKYIEEKNDIWTTLDTIQLNFLEKIIELKAKKGYTVLNYWHHIRTNVITKLEEKGFYCLPLLCCWEITWNGKYEKGETNDVECN